MKKEGSENECISAVLMEEGRKEGSSHSRIVIPEGWKGCSFFLRFFSSFIFSFFHSHKSLSLSLTFYSSSSSFSLLHCSSSHPPLLMASGTIFDVFSREKRKRFLSNCSPSLFPHFRFSTSLFVRTRFFLKKILQEKNSTKFQDHVSLGDRFTLFDFTWVFSSRSVWSRALGRKGCINLRYISPSLTPLSLLFHFHFPLRRMILGENPVIQLLK